MSTNIPAVQNTKQITDSEFIKLIVNFTDGNTVITRNFFFSNSYKQESINGDVYNDLSGLLSVGYSQRDISSSGFDTAVSLSGLDDQYIYLVAGGPATSPIPVTGQSPIPIGYYPLIKGSKIQITRGFYNSNYILTSSALRYTGIITSYSINEERDNDFAAMNDTFTVVLQSSAIRRVLENRIAGRKTNSKSWKYWYSNDTSMDRVSGLEGKQFDFGKDVKTGTGNTSSTSPTINNTTTTTLPE